MADFNKTHDISIRSLSPGSSEIRMDGADISRAVYGYSISQNVNELPRVVLSLAMYELKQEAKALVSIPEETRTLLRALGWTPPEEVSDDGRDTGCTEGSPQEG